MKLGNIGDASRKFLQNWMNLYVAWVKRYRCLKKHKQLFLGLEIV